MKPKVIYNVEGEEIIEEVETLNEAIIFQNSLVNKDNTSPRIEWE